MSTTAAGGGKRTCEKGENKECRWVFCTHRDDYIFEWTQGEGGFFKKHTPPAKNKLFDKSKFEIISETKM